MLLAAGRGKRLRPLTDAVAKPVLPVLDVPLAAWGLSALCAEAAPVIVNVSHLADGVVSALGELGLEGWEAVTESPEPYGTAGTLASLRDRIGSRVVTWNSDVLTSLRPRVLVAAHSAGGAAGTVAVRAVERNADLVVESGRVIRFVDRRREDVAGAQFLGAAVFEQRALRSLPEEKPAGLGETLLRTLAERGELAAHVTSEYWIDVGTPERYVQASLDVLYERAPVPPVPIPGDVVEVEGGRAYIGPGAHVGTESLGPGAIVLSGATVEQGAWLENALVWPHEHVPAARYERTVVHRPPA